MKSLSSGLAADVATVVGGRGSTVGSGGDGRG